MLQPRSAVHLLRPLAALLVLGTAAAYPPDVQFSDLGAPRADLRDLRGLINNRGTVAITGALRTAGDDEPDRGFVLRQGAFTALAPPRGVVLPGSRTLALNDLDEVAGYFFLNYESYHPFWYNARTSRLYSVADYIHPDDRDQARGLHFTVGLTNSGKLLGAELVDYDTPWVFDLRTGRLADFRGFGLDYPFAYAINNREWIAGGALEPGFESFLYHVGSASPVPVSATAEALSDTQTLVDQDYEDQDLVFWRSGATSRVPLPGPLTPSYPDPVRQLVINDWNEVVGTYEANGVRVPFVFDGTAVHALDDLVPASRRAGWAFDRATGINDLGEIVGSLRRADGAVRLFRLQPSPAAVSDGTWRSIAVDPPGATFTVTYDAVPMAGGLDAVTGLSHGAADAFTDLAAAVRFAPDGRIDARNGGQFEALQLLPYESGLACRVRLVINLATRRYSATVTPAGGGPVAIARDFAFRTQQGGVTRLDRLNVRATGGAVSIGRVHVQPDVAPVLSLDEWTEVPFAAQTGRFEVAFDAIPSAANLNGVLGLALGPADAYGELAASVRFAPSGVVDARNGSVYQTVNAFFYQPGVRYRIALSVDVAARRYSASVTAPGGPPVVIAHEYAFRAQQSGARRLDRLALLTTGGAVEVSEFHLPARDAPPMAASTRAATPSN